jgi:hypothetical protein
MTIVRQIATRILPRPSRRQNLVVLATIGFFALFAPLVCILQCHLFLHTNAANSPASTLFVCHLHEAPALSHSQPGTALPQTVVLPRVVYDLLLTNSLALALLVLVAAHVTLRAAPSTPCFLQPPTPPPR